MRCEIIDLTDDKEEAELSTTSGKTIYSARPGSELSEAFRASAMGALPSKQSEFGLKVRKDNESLSACNHNSVSSARRMLLRDDEQKVLGAKQLRDPDVSRVHERTTESAQVHPSYNAEGDDIVLAPSRDRFGDSREANSAQRLSNSQQRSWLVKNRCSSAALPRAVIILDDNEDNEADKDELGNVELVSPHHIHRAHKNFGVIELDGDQNADTHAGSRDIAKTARASPLQQTSNEGQNLLDAQRKLKRARVGHKCDRARATDGESRSWSLNSQTKEQPLQSERKRDSFASSSARAKHHDELTKYVCEAASGVKPLGVVSGNNEPSKPELRLADDKCAVVDSSKARDDSVVPSSKSERLARTSELASSIVQSTLCPKRYPRSPRRADQLPSCEESASIGAVTSSVPAPGICNVSGEAVLPTGLSREISATMTSLLDQVQWAHCHRDDLKCPICTTSMSVLDYNKLFDRAARDSSLHIIQNADVAQIKALAVQFDRIVRKESLEHPTEVSRQNASCSANGVDEQAAKYKPDHRAEMSHTNFIVGGPENDVVVDPERAAVEWLSADVRSSALFVGVEWVHVHKTGRKCPVCHELSVIEMLDMFRSQLDQPDSPSFARNIDPEKMRCLADRLERVCHDLGLTTNLVGGESSISVKNQARVASATQTVNPEVLNVCENQRQHGRSSKEIKDNVSEALELDPRSDPILNEFEWSHCHVAGLKCPVCAHKSSGLQMRDLLDVVLYAAKNTGKNIVKGVSQEKLLQLADQMQIEVDARKKTSGSQAQHAASKLDLAWSGSVNLGSFSDADEAKESKSDLRKKPTTETRLSDIPEALVFHPSEEEFQDPVAYIRKIQPMATKTGICKVRAPESWRARQPDKIRGDWSIRTRVQPIHQLLRRSDDSDSDLFGYDDGPTCTVDRFRMIADDYKKEWEQLHHSCTRESKRADRRRDRGIEVMEREFWSTIDSGLTPLYTLYANDMNSTELEGGGFDWLPAESAKWTLAEKLRAEHELLKANPWNLNCFPNLNDTLLRYVGRERDVKLEGICEPWIYFGMLFSTFCWHTEDNYLYSINYMHSGGDKVWYGVPQTDAAGFERVFLAEHRSKFKRNNILSDLNTLVSVDQLMEAGVKLFRLVQREGDFVITFPQVYHCGFSTGFNCAEAVNFALPEWMQYGELAEQRAKQFRKQPVTTNEELLYCIFREKGVLSKLHVTPEAAHDMSHRVIAAITRELGNRDVCEKTFGPGSLRREVAAAHDGVVNCFHCKRACVFSCVSVKSFGRNEKRLLCLHHALVLHRAKSSTVKNFAASTVARLVYFARSEELLEIVLSAQSFKSSTEREAQSGPNVKAECDTQPQAENSTDGFKGNANAEDAPCIACTSRPSRTRKPWTSKAHIVSYLTGVSSASQMVSESFESVDSGSSRDDFASN